MNRLPAREVHLDFHTSGDILGIGSRFDKEQFQEMLQVGHVNSITVFGKGHHGYCYYPTKVGTQHPGMEQGRDLAGEMMDACHEIGVRAPLYLTVGFSALDAQEHPEWIIMNRDGSFSGVNYDFEASNDTPKPYCSWANLCTAGGYRDYLYKLTEEVCQRYKDLDGLFYDIVFVTDYCYCDDCIRGMKEMGLDPEVEADAKKYYQIQKKKTLDGIREIFFRYHPDGSIFFNSGGAEIHMPQWHYASTHFELEDLPTKWGGYDKMPIRAMYFGGKGKDYLGMTGKFHESWGEFGGYKTPEALRYECASLLTWGARISVGDQMHPLGMLDKATYENIGYAFSYIEKIEDYCFDVQVTSRIAVMVGTDASMNEAIAKLMLDSHLDFDIVRAPSDVMKYELIILPDRYRITKEYEKALVEYQNEGRKLLLLGGSGLREDADEFAISTELIYKGRSSYDIDYLEVAPGKFTDMINSPILCYSSAHIVEGKGEVLAGIREPYFSRTYGHYCSHGNTPYSEGSAEYPAAIRDVNTIYVAHEMASMYLNKGCAYHRRYFSQLVEMLVPDRNVEVTMPVQGRVRFVEQPKDNRYILHLLYASPIQRGDVSVLEDFPNIGPVKVRVSVKHDIGSVTLQPQGKALDFAQRDSHVCFTVDEFSMHQIVVLDYSV